METKEIKKFIDEAYKKGYHDGELDGFFRGQLKGIESMHKHILKQIKGGAK